MASQAITAKQLINKLKHEREKLMCTQINIAFNKLCKKEKVVPNYIKIDIKNQSLVAQKTLKQARQFWLANEIKNLYKKSCELSLSVKAIKKELKRLISVNDFENVIAKINVFIDNKRKEKIRITNGKLDKLIKSQKKSFIPIKNDIHTFYPRVVNLTEVVFNDEENSMLGKWSKFNPPTKNMNNDDIKNLIMETEIAISYLDKEKQSKIRYDTVRKLENIISKSKARRNRSKKHFTFDKLTAGQIKDKLRDNSAKVVEADKSNATVIIYDTDLDSKVHDFFEKNGVFEINDKTNEFNKSLKALLGDNCIIPPNKIKSLYNTKAAPPQFKPLVKTHKNDLPIRPVINSVNAPSYRLSKYLANLIKCNINMETENTSKNSIVFIEKLQKYETIKNNIFITMDVDNMYANIPREEAIQVLISELRLSNKLSDCEIKDIGLMIEEITKQNYFAWKNKFYYDTKGLPMGGPLSALLAELYLQKYEKDEILSGKNPYRQKIAFYNRYVDDCFIIYKGTKRQTKLLVNYLNNLNTPIRFKLEVEDNNSISFLDVKIFKADNKVSFGIFRKPTQTDLVIPKDSNHPHQYKLASFRSMVYRLLTYHLSPQEYVKEMKIIKQIAFNNGYDPYIIDNVVRKTKIKLLNNTTNKKIDKFVPLGYVNKHSETIGHIFKRHHIFPGYKVQKNISLNCGRPKNDKINSKGVYMIECNGGDTCGKKYIGCTNRSFFKRFKEHNAVNQNNPSSKVAQHLKQNNSHKINFDHSLKVLKHCHDNRKAQVWEEYFIYDSVIQNGKNLLLNKKEDFSDKITYQLFNRLVHNNEPRQIDQSADYLHDDEPLTSQNQ